MEYQPGMRQSRSHDSEKAPCPSPGNPPAFNPNASKRSPKRLNIPSVKATTPSASNGHKASIDVDLSCLSPDVVVVMTKCRTRLETLIGRAAAPGYKIYGLSGHPDSKHSHPQCNDACDGVFALTPDLDELKKRLVSIRR